MEDVSSTSPRSPAPLGSLPPALRGALAGVLLVLNTLAGFLGLFPVALLKLVLPARAVRRAVDRWLNAVGEWWIANNGRWMGLVHPLDWRVVGLSDLRRDRWYLVVANHQSAVDILVLQHVFNRRIPFLKFFLKRELIWVPVIGLCWWALDYPFMKRHSQRFLREHPERRGDDVAAIRRACARFALVPTSVMSFVEGTRFTAHKHAAQQSPYARLLRPRVGGVALALNAMGEQFHALVDVTLFYPGGIPTLVDLLCGRLESVVVEIRERPIPASLVGGNYAADADYRARAQEWMEGLWAEKERALERLAGQDGSEVVRRSA
jgi:1-acyl-sn-glycerol-3-phosphate acyltransferase